MVNVREILRQIGMEKTERQAAKLSGSSRTAVKNVIERAGKCGLSIESLCALNDQDLKNIIYPPKERTDKRYTILQERIPDIIKELGRKHETLQNQWEIYFADNIGGYSYSQFCHHLLQAQKAEVDIDAIFNYKYGDLMFVDYAGDTVSYTGLDGIEIFVKVFVAILPASQFTYAGLSKNETTEEWVEQSTRALEYIGGVPDAIIPDCAKAVVNKADKFEPELNTQYKRFAEHYKTSVVPARPYSPEDKALVENSINNIYRYIYPRLRSRNCASFEELEAAFAELLEVYNRREMRRYRASRYELYMENEKKELGDLPVERYIYHKYQAPRKVGTMSHIYLKEDQHYYSVPYQYARRKCEIYYTLSAVKIFCDNERLCIHPRKKGVGRYTTDTSHLSYKLRSFMEWEPEKAKMKAAEYDPAVVTLVENIFSTQAHHLQARKSIYGVFDLVKKYKSARFIAACKMAVRKGVKKYSTVKTILEKGLDKTEREQTTFEYSEVIHENIRYKTEEKNNDRTNNEQNEVTEDAGYAVSL